MADPRIDQADITTEAIAARTAASEADIAAQEARATEVTDLITKADAGTLSDSELQRAVAILLGSTS